MPRTTMGQLSYGLTEPAELLMKLQGDAALLTADPHPFDVFNFIVTAAVLAAWIFKAYPRHATVVAIKAANDERNPDHLPVASAQWIQDRACLPNKHCDVRRHIMNAMRICWESANASKHFHWFASSSVKAIGPTPIVSTWYQYYFTSRKPDLYIDYGGEYYGLSQVKGILLQFYEGLLQHIQATQAAGIQDDAEPPA